MSFDGLSEAPTGGFWAGIGQMLGAGASKIIDAKAQAEILKAQGQLYTPQNLEIARQQAEFARVQSGGLSTAAMVGLGLAGVALVVLLKRK